MRGIIYITSLPQSWQAPMVRWSSLSSSASFIRLLGLNPARQTGQQLTDEFASIHESRQFAQNLQKIETLSHLLICFSEFSGMKTECYWWIVLFWLSRFLYIICIWGNSKSTHTHTSHAHNTGVFDNNIKVEKSALLLTTTTCSNSRDGQMPPQWVVANGWG